MCTTENPSAALCFDRWGTYASTVAIHSFEPIRIGNPTRSRFAAPTDSSKGLYARDALLVKRRHLALLHHNTPADWFTIQRQHCHCFVNTIQKHRRVTNNATNVRFRQIQQHPCDLWSQIRFNHCSCTINDFSKLLKFHVIAMTLFTMRLASG